MLSVQEVSASYRETPVLEGVTFYVSEGDFLGIIGPNGAGKTTLLKVITGVKKTSGGKVTLDGKDISCLSRKEIARIMAVVPQSSFLPPLFTVEDVVLLGRYPHQKARFSVAESEEDIKMAEEAMRKTNTLSLRHRLVGELSGGERQEVIIARAMAQEPKILVLDEPTSNLDIKHQLRILDLIKSLVDRRVITAIMVIHDLNLAARFCNRLILLHNGRIHSQGRPEKVLTPENLKRAYEVKTEISYQSSIDSLNIIVIGQEKETVATRNGGCA